MRNPKLAIPRTDRRMHDSANERERWIRGREASQETQQEFPGKMIIGRYPEAPRAVRSLRFRPTAPLWLALQRGDSASNARIAETQSAGLSLAPCRFLRTRLHQQPGGPNYTIDAAAVFVHQSQRDLPLMPRGRAGWWWSLSQNSAVDPAPSRSGPPADSHVGVRSRP